MVVEEGAGDGSYVEQERFRIVGAEGFFWRGLASMAVGNEGGWKILFFRRTF